MECGDTGIGRVYINLILRDLDFDVILIPDCPVGEITQSSGSNRHFGSNATNSDGVIHDRSCGLRQPNHGPARLVEIVAVRAHAR